MKRNPLIRYWLAVTALLALTLAALPAQAENTAEKLLNQIHNATWISEGKSPHVIYVFFDPNCPFCHTLYEELRPHVKNNAVEVRWIPIGVLRSTSLGKAAAILEAKSPIHALYKNEDDWNFGDTPYGGLNPLPNPSAAAVKQLDTNVSLLNSVGIRGVPLTVFRGDDGVAYSFPAAPAPEKLAEILKHVK